ncbi:MAG TPA: carboxypeptidase-like regulatory domain-containing protein, partial [Verrucomicrobiae bacterium]
SSTAEIVVEADHMAPQLTKLELDAPTNTINFVLQDGNIFQGRVFDEAGQPIAGAAARTDSDNQGRRPFDWFSHTDTEGAFFWDAAPSDAVLVWFEADGYQPIRDMPVHADGTEYKITLKRSTR